MRTTATIVIFILLSSVLFQTGCSDPYVHPALKDLDLRLFTLDREYNERIYFDKESDIVLALKAINHSKDTLELGRYYNPCFIINNNKDFFFVYKVSQLNELIPVGSPFEIPVICNAMYYPHYLPPNNERFMTVAGWPANPENHSMEPGKYLSSFSIDLNGRIFRLETRFEVRNISN